MFNATGIPGTQVSLYEEFEANGVIVIIVVATVSLAAVTALLLSLMIVVLKPRTKSTAQTLFLQSNVGTYFISLLVADMIQAIGSIINIHWVSTRAVQLGSLCTAQGAIKNLGNVASAIWTMVIAVHIFNLLFLRLAPKKYVSVAVTIATWSFICTLAISGPAVIRKQNIGFYYGISGYWCWITEQYPGARIGLEYFWMFFCGASSFVLYALVFLRLRGNITTSGWRWSFRWVPRAQAWKLQATRDAVDAHMTAVSRQMIWHPVAYTVVIIPIAIARFLDSDGVSVPFGWTVFADSLFMLSGFINVVLFLRARKYLPAPTVLPTFNIPRKPPPSAFELPDSESVTPLFISLEDDKSPQRQYDEKVDGRMLEDSEIAYRAAGVLPPPPAHTLQRPVGRDISAQNPFARGRKHHGAPTLPATPHPNSRRVTSSLEIESDESPRSAHLQDVDLHQQQHKRSASTVSHASHVTASTLSSLRGRGSSEYKPEHIGGRV